MLLKIDPPNALVNDHNSAQSEHVYLDVRQAADYLRLRKATLDKLRCLGTGPRFAKLGRRVVYRRVDLDAWAAARIVGSTSEADRRLGNGPPTG